MNRHRGFATVFVLACALALLPGPGWGTTTVLAQRGAGTEQVRASVRCDGSAMTVTIDNAFWNSITVGYIGAFTTGQALNPTFYWTETDPALRVRIDADDRQTIDATVMERMDGGSGTVQGALIVTTAGVLMPFCDDGFSGLLDDPGDAPADITDATTILVDAAALTIGRLESLRAYDALYALLHPDVQALVPPAALACWYADQYGTADRWKDSVFSTQVEDVATVNDWEWIAGGITYDQAVEVTYTQEIGTLTSSSRSVEGTMHFVAVDQEYRWFFGNRVDSLNHLDTNCGL